MSDEYSGLLKSQKNEIFELVKFYKLDPFNFKWVDENSDMTQNLIVSKLTYGDTGFYFKFDIQLRSHYSIFSPGSDKLVQYEYPGSWETQIRDVKKWLSNLYREIEQPDLWTNISYYQLSENSNIDPSVINTPFTFDEVEKILIGISDIKNYIQENINIQTDKLEQINENLEYLSECAKRQGRRDWIHTCIGVIFTLSTALALSPEQAQNIWEIIKKVIAGIIKLIPESV